MKQEATPTHMKALRPETTIHHGTLRRRGGQHSPFSLSEFLSHICQHDPITDESQAATAAPTDGKATLGGQKERVRGKMERNWQLWQREQRGEFLPSELMDGAAETAAPSMSPGPSRCRLTAKTPGRRHVETECENERGQRAAICRRWQKQAEPIISSI